jgi:hypothetical protein
MKHCHRCLDRESRESNESKESKESNESNESNEPRESEGVRRGYSLSLEGRGLG